MSHSIPNGIYFFLSSVVVGVHFRHDRQFCISASAIPPRAIAGVSFVARGLGGVTLPSAVASVSRSVSWREKSGSFDKTRYVGTV